MDWPAFIPDLWKRLIGGEIGHERDGEEGREGGRKVVSGLQLWPFALYYRNIHIAFPAGGE